MQPKLPAAVVGKTPHNLEEAAATFLADCQARNLSPATVELNCIVLTSFRNFTGNIPIAQVTPSLLRQFLIDKASNTSPATAARYYDTLRRFFGFLEAEGFCIPNPMNGVRKPRAPVPIIKPLSTEEVERLVNSCDSRTFCGIRDRLILLILVDCGLRATELCNLELSDVDLDNRQFLVRRGKGNRSRRVPFGAAVLGLLRQYLARRAEVEEPKLLVNVYGEPIDRYRLRAIVRNAAQRAGVKCSGPHQLRHTCGVEMLRAGADVFTVQKVLGHSTLLMTRRYCELADSDVQTKHALYSPADRLKTAEAKRKKRLR
jgi:site-specific recombinase XerD